VDPHPAHAAPGRLAVLSPICSSRVVVTAFDVSYEAHPAHYPLGLRLRLSTLVPYSVRRAARVFTISEYSKQQLIEWYRLPPDKIEVVSCGVDTELYRPIQPAEARDRLRARYAGLEEDFLLYVGSLQPRKNVARLLEAFALLDDESGRHRQLLVVGKWKWLTVEVETALERFGLRDRVRFTGHVPDEDLPLFLNSAAALVFPSLYEGFGLPVLEAMACGTPVVCADATSLPEIARGAAELVDPYDAEDIARGLHAVLSSPARRAELRQQGLQRAAAFTWEETARRALRVFMAVAGER